MHIQNAHTELWTIDFRIVGMNSNWNPPIAVAILPGHRNPNPALDFKLSSGAYYQGQQGNSWLLPMLLPDGQRNRFSGRARHFIFLLLFPHATGDTIEADFSTMPTLFIATAMHLKHSNYSYLYLNTRICATFYDTFADDIETSNIKNWQLSKCVNEFQEQPQIRSGWDLIRWPGKMHFIYFNSNSYLNTYI